MKKLTRLTIFAFLFSISSSICESNSSINVGADLMSRYIFRGVDYGHSPSIQPTFAFKNGNFEIGYWGAIALNSSYQETDLYLKYSIGSFSIMVTDYYIPTLNDNPAAPDIRYFTFDDKKTAHTLEGTLSYQFGEAFPLKIAANVFFYGNDKRWGYDDDKDSKEDTYYSSYFELGYPIKVGGNNVDAFIGFTPAAGAFGNTMGVVNMGFTGYKSVKISDSFELPVKSSIIFNPQAENVFFIFGITL